MHVVSVGYAPVKGTRHRSFDWTVFDGHGPVGDRRFCVVDVEARQVLRTVQHPALLTATVSSGPDGLSIASPVGEATGPAQRSGDRVDCDYWGRTVTLDLLTGPHADLFSALVGRPVRLAQAPRGGVVFGDPVLVVTLPSVRDLAARCGRPALVEEVGRFRPTLVLDGDMAPYADEDWCGRDLSIGDLRLRVGGPVPRCAVIDRHPTSGERDVRLMRALAAYRPVNRAGEPSFGMFARVATPGTVSPRSGRFRGQPADVTHQAAGRFGEMHGGGPHHGDLLLGSATLQ